MGEEATTLGDLDITGLRRAAAMAHTVGGIAVELRSGGRLLATVRPAGPWAAPAPSRGHPAQGGLGDRGAMALDTCGFRLAVARAWGDHREGRRLALVGQDVGELDIGWSIRPPGHLLGFGAARTNCGGRLVWAMASLLPPTAMTAVLEELDDPPGSDQPDAEIEPWAAALAAVEARLVRDDLLGVSVVHVEVGPEQFAAAPPGLVAMLDEVICRLVAANAAAELLDALRGVAAAQMGGDVPLAPAGPAVS